MWRWRWRARSLNADAGGGVTVEMKTSFLQPAKAGTRLLVSGFAYHRSMTHGVLRGRSQGCRRAIDRQSHGNVQIPKIRSCCRWLNSYRRIVLASRPQGWPSPENFRLEEAPMPALDEGEVRVRNRFLSLDPYMRGRMNEAEILRDAANAQRDHGRGYGRRGGGVAQQPIRGRRHGARHAGMG